MFFCFILPMIADPSRQPKPFWLSSLPFAPRCVQIVDWASGPLKSPNETAAKAVEPTVPAGDSAMIGGSLLRAGHDVV